MAKEEVAKVVRAVRKIRHWKQRYDKNAAFVWRKNTTWTKQTPGKRGRQVVFPAGSVVPTWVREAMGGAKLRRFWEAHRIELLEFNEPNVATGKAKITPGQETTRPREGAAKKKAATKKKKKARKKVTRKRKNGATKAAAPATGNSPQTSAGKPKESG